MPPPCVVVGEAVGHVSRIVPLGLGAFVEAEKFRLQFREALVGVEVRVHRLARPAPRDDGLGDFLGWNADFKGVFDQIEDPAIAVLSVNGYQGEELLQRGAGRRQRRVDPQVCNGRVSVSHTVF